MRILLTTLFSVFCLNLIGQHFFTNNLSAEQGLPSNQVYDILQDKKGFIWIATDAGISRYDGNEITSFQQSDGLADNSIVQMNQSKDGTLWFLGFNKSFTIYKDSFQHFRWNNRLNEVLQKQLITSFYPFNDDSLLIGLNSPCGTKWSGLLVSNGEIQSYKNQPDSWLEESLEVFNTSGCAEESQKYPKQIQAISTQGDRTVITGGKQLLVQEGGVLTQQSTTTAPITKALLNDSKGNVWVGTYSGLLYYPKGDLTQKPWVIKSKQPISCIMEDRDGSIWFGTFSNGVFHIPSASIQYYSNLTTNGNNDFQGLAQSKNKLFAFNRNNSLVQLAVAGNKLVLEKTEAIDDNISELLVNNGELTILTENQFSEAPNVAKFKGITAIKSSEKNTYWVGGLYYFSKIFNSREVFNSVQIDFQERVNCLAEIDKNHLWLGTVNGVYEYVDGKIRHVESTKNLNITCLAYKNEQLIFGTRGQGLGILTDTIKWYNRENGLSNNFVNCILLDEQSFWVGTKAGINQINEDRTTSFTRTKGLLFEETTDIKKMSNQLALSTSNGIVLVDVDYLNSKIPLLNTIIILNGKPVEKSQESTFNYDQQNISLEFITHDYFQLEKTTFRYRLNADSTWNTTQQRLVRYESLPPGKYLFEVQAKNRNGIFNSKSSTFSIIVSSPYYQTTWFYCLAAIIIGFVFYVVLKWQVDKNNKRMQMENELSALKIKALSAQMNPHFIFNSLNSIQNFLIDSDLRKSNKYLTKFAKLMRLVLNNSDKTFVPIKDVLSSLDLYLELEKLRFNDRFDYTFNIDPKIELETTHIPSMLIQPFVENAILHGILPREGKGNIKVSIEYVADHSLLCTIVDDGVGRDFHSGKLGKKHKSQGLRITKERLDVFKQLFKSEFEFSFHDLKDDFDKPKGTKVELTVPSR